MKPKHFFCYVGLLLLIPNFVLAQTFFTAKFTTAQQGHEVVSADSASGTAALVLDAEGLHYYITVANLSGPIAAAHFHNGAAGENGGVVRTITEFVGGTASGVWTAGDAEALTPELVQALMAGNLYLNVHTAANGAGEVRAQVQPTSGAGLSAVLSTAQETHDINVTVEGITPTGTASFQATPAGVAFYITVYGLTSPLVGAHLHHAPMGQDGPVVRSLTDAFGEGVTGGQTAFGVWTPGDAEPLTPDMFKELLAGNIYVNVHTANNQAGLLRGQALLSEGTGFTASLDATQEPGGVTSEARGTATLTLTDAGLTYAIAVTGLEEGINGAHIHNAPAGTNGGVVHSVIFDGHTAYGTWTPNDTAPFSVALAQELLLGNLYFNIHTASNPGGEIRGQILIDPNTTFSAHLTPAQENHDVTGADQAEGVAFLSLSPEGLSYQITVDSLSGDIAAAHFHLGAAGQNGGVVRTVPFDGNNANGTWAPGDATEPLTPELLAALMTGQLYLNVHTTANGSGEIRGQVNLSSGTQLRASLTEAQQSHEVSGTGEAQGTATMTLTPAGLVFNLTAETLTGDIAAMHFHQARAGEDGGVVRGLGDDQIPESKSAHGFWSPQDAEPLTPELRNALLAGDLYVNIHTAANGAGEIRGQAYLSAGTGIAVPLGTDQEVGTVVSADSAAGTAAVTLTNSGLVFDLTVADLSGPIAAAHIHNAPAGQNGGVVRPITDDFGSPTAFGVWRGNDAAPFTLELANELLAGNLYFNIHTAANGSGELRGQIRSAQGRITSLEPVDGGVIPQSITLEANYPNPFNPATTMTFSVPQATKATLRVYNALGQTVAVLVNETLAAGQYQVTFDAAGLPSGMYFYQLEAAGVQQTRKMTLVK